MGSSELTLLTQLADAIKASTLTIEDYLVRHGQPSPSLDVNGVSLSIPATEKNTLEARDTILSATRELRSLVSGPVGILMNIGAHEVLCLQTIYRYKIASSFGVHEQVTFEAISAACQLNIDDLRRILRYAMTDHIFCEPQPGIVAHTAASRLLAEDTLIRDFVGNVCEVRFPASVRTVDALEKYGKSQDVSQSGFSLSRNTPRGIYDEFLSHEEEGRRWNGAMRALASQIDLNFILDSFPWTSFVNATILDIGGGCGDISIGLKNHVPSANFIVQDMSKSACKQGQLNAASKGRDVRFEIYDFRNQQHIHGADVYYFRNIFHNWPDKNCLEILRNQIPSLKKNARIVIDDFTLHEPGTLNAAEDRKQRWMDINMLVFFGSRERTVSDWKRLLNAADPRFQLVNVSMSPHQPNSILEIIWTA